MRTSIPIRPSVDLLLTQNELGFESLLRKVPTAARIAVATYNVDQTMLDVLSQAPTTAHIELVTNIPDRFPTYFSSSAREKARVRISQYRKLLAPDLFKAGINVFYNLANHSKIIIVDDMAYVGSANLSAASSRSFECGVLLTDAAIVGRLFSEVFSTVRNAGVAVLPKEASEIALALRSAGEAIESATKEFFELLEDKHAPLGRTHRRLTFSQLSVRTLEETLDNLESLLDDSPDIERLDASLNTVRRALDQTRAVLFTKAIRDAVEFDEDTFTQSALEMNKEAYDENLDAAADEATQASVEKREELYKRAERELESLVSRSGRLVISIRKSEDDAIALINAAVGIDNT